MLSMDIKVYTKEEVLLPTIGNTEVYVPNVIDLMPIIDSSSGQEVITGAVEVLDGSKDSVEQSCSLATIWQRGLDPLDLTDGIQWSEVMLGEIPVTEIMNELVDTIASLTASVTVVFDTITDDYGKSYLSYRLQEVA